MKQQTKISIALVLAAVLVSVAFQNCSNVNFASTASMKGDDDRIQIDTPDRQSLPDVVDEPTTTPNPPSEQPPTTQPPAPRPDLPKDNEVEQAHAACDGLPAVVPDFSTASNNNVLLENVDGPRVVASANNVRIVNFRGDVDVQKARDIYFENARGSAALSGANVGVVNFRAQAAGERLLIDAGNLNRFENLRTPICVRAASFASLVNFRSDGDEPVVFIGRTVNGVKPKIDRLENFRGIVILRGVDIETLINFRGRKLVLEDSVVGEMNNVRTDIYLKNSIIGNEVNVQGSRQNY